MALNTPFEKRTCGRCRGSGSYSYNSIDGSRCYGCNGKGEVLTARGKRQRDAYLAMIEARAGDLKPGDVMSCTGWKRFTVKEVRDAEPVRCKSINDTEWRSVPMVTLVGAKSNYTMGADDKVSVLPKTNEDRDRMVAEALKTK